ncbi:MAG: cytochrome c oxidase accessory protein CcoG [Burkholderiales bacterium]|jgi:cytochrome c oxidase accessory protein FixG|nr:cytochrome c oxidase accessory protein CcoG [Burkholderiales bacterium]
MSTSQHGSPLSEKPIQWVSMWQGHQTVQPRWIWGSWTARRWLMVLLTQALFYGLPWLHYNDRPLVLFDLLERRFYLLAWVFYPQDLIYLTVLLVVCALALFLFTTVAGRVWCGFACPQTVYSEIFMGIERLFEGDRSSRLKIDADPWHFPGVFRRLGKHGVWLLIAAWTGFSFVGYFTPIDALGQSLLQAKASGWETFWVGFYGLATYGNAGFMREQLCKYLCPYARFQGAMFDTDSLIVSYDAARGEPRGTRGRKDDFFAQGLGACVDCGLCVQVCPTGIDIRKGLQYECISCAACIDACNLMMDKMRYPRGLVKFTSERAQARGWGSGKIWLSLTRPRVLLYSLLLWLLMAGTTLALVMRPDFRADIVRDRAALYRINEQGRVENVYRLQLMNNSEHRLQLALNIEGLPGGVLAESSVYVLPAAKTQWVVVHASAAEDLAAGTHGFDFVITARRLPIQGQSTEAGVAETRREKTVFIQPR